MPPVTAILLAAGKGVRMRSAKPKVLHEILGRPMIEWALKAALDGGANAATVVIPEDGSALRQRLGPSVQYAVQREARGTGHALLAAREAIEAAGSGGRILVLAGDAPAILPETLAEVLRVHVESGAETVVLTADVAEPRGYGRILRGPQGRIAAIVEEKDATPEQRSIREVNSGVYCFRAAGLIGELEALKPSPATGEIYLTDVVARQATRGLAVVPVKVSQEQEIWGVNDRVQLAAVGAVMRDRILRGHMLRGVTIVDPANTYIEADVEIAADVTIWPYTVICRGVRIAGRCSVGPFAHLREGSVLEAGAEIGNFVETKKAILGEGVKAKHLSYLGDVTIGRSSNIGAGTIVANYDGVRKSHTTIGDRAFIGSGTVLIAPVSVGQGAVTAAGAVVTKNSPVGDGEVWAGVPARFLRPKEEPQC